MAVSASMSVSSNPAGTVLTLSDTSTGLGTVSARTFTVYNSLGDLVQVIDSPTSATADYAVTADAYWSFTLEAVVATVEVNNLLTLILLNCITRRHCVLP